MPVLTKPLTRNQIRDLADTAYKVDISSTLTCPDCGTSNMSISQSQWGRYYTCDLDRCPGRISAADDGTLKGLPANKATRLLRSRVYRMMEESGISLNTLKVVLKNPELRGISFMTQKDCEDALRPFERLTSWQRLLENPLGV